MRTADLRKRYGAFQRMSVERRLSSDPTFPRPIYIAKRRFWRLARSLCMGNQPKRGGGVISFECASVIPTDGPRAES